MSKKADDFNNFRFEGLSWKHKTNKYLSMERVNEEETKIVVKVADEHLLETKFGYALILDATHVVFIKDWQVSKNYYGNEVLLQKSFFNVKEWGSHTDFGTDEENLKFETWLEIAKKQNEVTVDEDGFSQRINPVKWEA